MDGAFPGDVIEPLSVVERKGFVRVETWRLVRPAASRVEPSCPVADRCGGCDWMRLGLEEQRRQKVLLLEEALRRTGKATGLVSAEAPPPVAHLGYRNRLRLHIDDRERLGLYAKGTHTLVELDACIVCRPEITTALRQLRTIARGYPSAFRDFQTVELRSPPSGGRIGVHFTPRPHRRLRAAARALVDRLGSDFDVAVLPAVEPIQQYALGPVRLEVPPGAFTQVHWEANLHLVDAVVNGARDRGVETFCDLYCGVGNFALPLLHAGCRGVAIDRHEHAVRAARHAAEDQGLQGEFLAADAPAAAAALVRDGRTFELVVLDPPRSGARSLIRDLSQLVERYLVYCSCDPVTLARDLGDLLGLGFEVESVHVIDLFPQTHHFETLVWFRRTADHVPGHHDSLQRSAAP